MVPSNVTLGTTPSITLPTPHLLCTDHALTSGIITTAEDTSPGPIAFPAKELTVTSTKA